MKNKEPRFDEVINLLKQAGQTGMAAELEEMNDSNALNDISPLSLLEKITTAQLIKNHNSATLRYTRQAHLYWPSAELTGIEYKPDRKLDKQYIDRLGTNDYIRYQQNLFVLGPTGSGNYAKQLIM